MAGVLPTKPGLEICMVEIEEMAPPGSILRLTTLCSIRQNPSDEEELQSQDEIE